MIFPVTAIRVIRKQLIQVLSLFLINELHFLYYTIILGDVVLIEGQSGGSIVGITPGAALGGGGSIVGITSGIFF